MGADGACVLETNPRVLLAHCADLRRLGDSASPTSLHPLLEARVAVETLPANVYLLHGDSAWADNRVFRLAVRILARTLAKTPSERQPVLLVDSAPIHIHRDVLASCRRLGLWVFLIPAGQTWLLQPAVGHLCVLPLQAVLA